MNYILGISIRLIRFIDYCQKSLLILCRILKNYLQNSFNKYSFKWLSIRKKLLYITHILWIY